jgi:hypothetical protein
MQRRRRAGAGRAGQDGLPVLLGDLVGPVEDEVLLGREVGRGFRWSACSFRVAEIVARTQTSAGQLGDVPGSGLRPSVAVRRDQGFEPVGFPVVQAFSNSR